MGVSFESTENISNKRALCYTVCLDVWDNCCELDEPLGAFRKKALTLRFSKREILDFIFTFIALTVKPINVNLNKSERFLSSIHHMKKHKTHIPAGDLNVSAPDHIKTTNKEESVESSFYHFNNACKYIIIRQLGESSSVGVHHLHLLIDPSHVKSVFDQQQLLLTATSLLPEVQHFKNKDNVLIWTNLWIGCTHTNTQTLTYTSIRSQQYGLWHCAAPVGVTAMYKPNIELYCLPPFLQKWKWKNKTIMRYMRLSNWLYKVSCRAYSRANQFLPFLTSFFLPPRIPSCLPVI